MLEIKSLIIHKNRVRAIKRRALDLGKNIPYYDTNIKKLFRTN